MKESNPQEALAKLEQLDRTRAEERMSLRHKNTGQWARNKQIKAKYDKEVSGFKTWIKKHLFLMKIILIKINI